MATSILGSTLVQETCCNCGIEFGMTKDLYHKRQEDGKSFYCPNGHSQYYTAKEDREKQIKELKQKLEKERQLRKRKEEEVDWFWNRLKEVEAKAEHAKRSRGQYKWRYEDLKEKLQNGECPYCDEKLDGIKDHMQSKHKDKIS